MDCAQAALTGVGILMNVWSCTCECANYKKILFENMQTLSRKMEELRSRKKDIKKELTNAHHLDGNKQKVEVETWLKNVRVKISEVQDREQKVGKRRYFSRSQFLRFVENNIQEVDELMENGRFPEGLFIDVYQDREVALVTTPLVGQSIKEKNLRKIWDCLTNDRITRIEVYGIGGIGKMTIATHIHNRVLESTSTFDCVYWVTVSQESSIHKLQHEIAKIMGLDGNLSDEQDERKRTTMLFKELTKRKKFILILDDTWKDFLMEKVGIPIGVDVGKLIVTTRSLEVCRSMNCQKISKVEPLSMTEAWDLFMEKLKPELMLAPDVEEIAESIVEECAGLPLAIITTAGSMKGVDDIHEWRNALNELREPTKVSIDMEYEVFKPLKFSYDRLNDEKVKEGFLYCALFPEDYKIPKEYLIVCWIAKGLVDEMKTRQAEFDRGHALLNKLENACLLERTTNSNGEICIKMNDVIRDMALNMTRVNSLYMVKAGVKLMEFPDEKERSENLLRVSIMHNDMEGQLSCISPKCPKLHTLMLQSTRHIWEIPISLFVHMQNLKVLDLSYLVFDCLPDSISNLEKLRALLLQCCSNLTYVPSLANLTELRVLDLWSTSIKELPHGMEKLVNLKRFNVSFFSNDTPLLVFPSGSLLNLSHLQSLRVNRFKITDDVHVKAITSLRRLAVLVIAFNNLQLFKSYVKTQHWQGLTHYTLRTREKDYRASDTVCCRGVHIDYCNLIGGGEDPLLLPFNMRELEIWSCNDLTSLLDISSSLKNASELKRCMIVFCPGINHLLWSLSIPSLEEEELKWCYLLLQSLRTLLLFGLENLSFLFNFKGTGIGGAIPKFGSFSNLKLFSVGGCQKLKYVFMRGLVQHHLQNLELIHVYRCHEMEKIIVADEEEKQEEIVAAKEEVITCPKLQRLELEDLPKLKSIWKGTMVCHSLQQIQVKGCPMLQRLPLYPQHSQISSTLKGIMGEEDWWDLLEWDYPDAKSAFQPLFVTNWLSPGTDTLRTFKIWNEDAEHYL